MKCVYCVYNNCMTILVTSDDWYHWYIDDTLMMTDLMMIHLIPVFDDMIPLFDVADDGIRWYSCSCAACDEAEVTLKYSSLTIPSVLFWHYSCWLLFKYIRIRIQKYEVVHCRYGSTVKWRYEDAEHFVEAAIFWSDMQCLECWCWHSAHYIFYSSHYILLLPTESTILLCPSVTFSDDISVVATFVSVTCLTLEPAGWRLLVMGDSWEAGNWRVFDVEIAVV